MRALVLASTFPHGDDDAAPAFVRDQVLALKRVRPDVHFDVLAPARGKATAALVDRGAFLEHRFTYMRPRRLQLLAGRGIVPSIEAQPALAALVPPLFLGQAFALWRHVVLTRPDVLYAHWFTPQGVVAAAVGRLTGVPWVLTSHANDVRVWRKLPGAGVPLVRALLPTAARITAVSASTRKKMEGFFSAPEWEALASRVTTLPMGVDVAALRARGHKERGDSGAPRTLLFIGRLVEKKGVDVLLRAWAALPVDVRARARLTIAGDGPLRAALEEQARALENVSFAGFVTGAHKEQVFRDADIVVVPSVEARSGDAEGFPVVVMEALAAHKVLIASDATGAEETLRHGVDSYVVGAGDVAALADALVRAIVSDDAPNVAAAGAARAGEFDWDAIAEAHARFLLDPFLR